MRNDDTKLPCATVGCSRPRDNATKYCIPHAKGMRRKLREQVLRDCGMVKVRGSQGGVYWE